MNLEGKFSMRAQGLEALLLQLFGESILKLKGLVIDI